jgi:DNA polymerase III epsilon subunit-like protein
MAFDRRMVRGTLSKTDRHFRFYKCFPRFQDTIKLVKDSGLTTGKSRSLGVICQELGIPHDHHDARSDAKVLIQIHKLATSKLGKENIMSLTEVAE